MVAALQDGRTDLVRVESLGVDLLRVAGIYGANAAGKSNVLAAFAFMAKAVTGSYRQWPPEGPIPREPFLLGEECQDTPSRFEADILVAGIHFRYGFILDEDAVLQEWLHAFPRGRRQVWFKRQRTTSYIFGKSLKGSNRVLAKLTRPNSLFLSAAAANNHPMLADVYGWFADRAVFSMSRDRSRSLEMLKEGREKPAFLDLLRLADLGIVDLDLQGDPSFEELLGLGPGSLNLGLTTRLELKHRSAMGNVSLPFDRESRGTQAWFSLSGPILDALQKGGLLCVDELDGSLHPHLAAEVVRIFQDSARNPKGAQLIFNTHDTSLLGTLLGEPVLYRDQVWFVEKDGDGATHLYPLTDFKPRKLENLERGYLQGRYGAIPFISPQYLPENVQATKK